MQRRRRRRHRAVLRRDRQSVDLLRQRGRRVLDRQRPTASADGRLRADPFGNHTWSHPNITGISPAAVADEIARNATFLRNTYGVDGTPYFRPPFGSHNADTDRIAADHGYRTVTLWSAEIGDSRPIDEAAMIATAL